MRVCFVTLCWPFGAAAGGISAFHQTLAQAMVGLGHDVTAIAPSHSGQDCARTDAGVKVRLLHAQPFFSRLVPSGVAGLARQLDYSLKVRRQIEAMCSQGELDVVEFPDLGATGLFYSLARSLRRRSPCPFVVFLHGSIVVRLVEGRQSGISVAVVNTLEGLPIKTSDLLLTPSESMRRLYAARLGLDPGTIKIIPCPVDTRLFTAHGASYRPPGGGMCVLYASRIEWLKGPDVLAAAIPKVCADVPDVQFMLVAPVRDPELRASLVGDLRQAMVLHQTHFLPSRKRTEMPEYYRGADVCVLPSRFENFPQVAAEAMACGTPVIASNVGGVGELVEDGVTGVLFPPGDSAALASAIISVLRDHGQRAEMGRQARMRMQRLFAADGVADATAQALARLLA